MDIDNFDPDELQRQIFAEELRRSGIKWSKYIPHVPTPQQRKFLALTCKEALYGGAAGGGKSDALLMAALQYVDIPNYSAILFRKTFADLNLAEALIPRSHEWLGGTDAKWDGQNHTWRFPSGAQLSFGYLDQQNDHYRYQGAAFQFIGFDELTQHSQKKYKYLFSRLRKTTNIPVPLRMWNSSNPGGVGHAWVKRTFINPKTRAEGTKFIPARVSDNPHLDIDEYVNSLTYLDDVTMQQLLNGDWEVTDDNRLVYAAFDRGLHMMDPPSYDPAYYGKVIAAVDPGTRDHYAVVILAREKSGKGWWQLDEFYRTGGTTLEFLPIFRKMQKVYKCSRWYVDREKPNDRIDLRSGGLPAVPNIVIYGEDKKHSIRPMIGVVLDIIKHDEFHISPKCQWTAEEMENYAYKEAEEKNAGENPIDFKNHLMDALRYGLCSAEDVGALRARYRRPPDMAPRERLRPQPTKIGTAREYLEAQEKKFESQNHMRRWGRRQFSKIR